MNTIQFENSTEDVRSFDDVQSLDGTRSPCTSGDRKFLALPPGLVMVEQLAAALRACLCETGRDEYEMFRGSHEDLHDVDRHLPDLDSRARWRPLKTITGECDSPSQFVRRERSTLLPSGFLICDAYKLVIARQYWIDLKGMWQKLILCAASGLDEYERFSNDIRQRRNECGKTVWQVVSGEEYLDGEQISRVDGSAKQPLLPAEILRRIDCDVIQFFSPRVAALYRAMDVPYRRGVLLYGPPGNGKTSTIRYAGAMLDDVSGLILRAKAGFDADDFEAVIKRWRRQAPAILVIEDLNWLIKEINLSSFLNLLDGIDVRANDGLLLMATTNHPEQLDPAINSRPGRFDVVIELPMPNAELRRRFLEGCLGGVGREQITKMAEASEEMSFAHLQEIVRLAGLMAIRAGRSVRTDEDLNEALASVRKGIDQVDRGFARELEVPFGLMPRR